MIIKPQDNHLTVVYPQKTFHIFPLTTFQYFTSAQILMMHLYVAMMHIHTPMVPKLLLKTYTKSFIFIIVPRPEYYCHIILMLQTEPRVVVHDIS